MTVLQGVRTGRTACNGLPGEPFLSRVGVSVIDGAGLASESALWKQAKTPEGAGSSPANDMRSLYG